MQVLVAGGTGFVGTALVRALLDRGHAVTVLARHPADADLPAAVDRVAVDLRDADPAVLRDAVAGHDAVVNLVALSPLFTPAGGNRAHEAVHLEGTAALVDAATAADVDRFVQVSALGADLDGATHYLRAKGRAEQVVREADLEWVIVRPSVVFGDGGEFLEFTRLLTTPYVTGLPGGGTTRFQPIWVGDLAPLLADCTVDADRGGDTYELGGPEVRTLAAVARRTYAADGTPLRVIPVPMPLAKLGLTVAGAVPGVPMGPDQYRSLRLDTTVAGGDPDANDVQAFDVDPAELRTLENYLDSTAAAGSGDANG
jgi:NADH dehydrogenase